MPRIGKWKQEGDGRWVNLLTSDEVIVRTGTVKTPDGPISIGSRTEGIEKARDWMKDHPFMLEAYARRRGMDETNRDAFSDWALYRGASRREAFHAIQDGHGQSSETDDLIGRDWEVLQFAFPDIRDMSEDEARSYLDDRMPDWARQQGMNTTTDYTNAKGYAGQDGIVLVFDEPPDVWYASDVHVQVKNPQEADLQRFYLPDGTCYIS